MTARPKRPCHYQLQGLYLLSEFRYGQQEASGFILAALRDIPWAWTSRVLVTICFSQVCPNFGAKRKCNQGSQEPTKVDQDRSGFYRRVEVGVCLRGPSFVFAGSLINCTTELFVRAADELRLYVQLSLIWLMESSRRYVTTDPL